MSVLEPQYEFELDEAFAKIRESLQGEDMEKFRSDFTIRPRSIWPWRLRNVLRCTIISP